MSRSPCTIRRPALRGDFGTASAAWRSVRAESPRRRPRHRDRRGL